MNETRMAPLTDDEAALIYHVERWGSDGYPVQKLGRRWFVLEFHSWKGFPTAFATKREAVAAFESWLSLAYERWREMKRFRPDMIMTGVGMRM